MYIFEETKSEYIVKKSRFIAYLFPLQSQEDANRYIKYLKDTHPDANHVCYGYVIGENDEISRSNDDGEPSGTAGMPILMTIKKEECHNILAGVVRYFGGVKLGASGLTRTYASCVKETLKIATKATKVTQYIYKLRYPYASLGDLESFLRNNGTVEEVLYEEDVSCLFKTSVADFPEKLIAQSKNQASYTLLRTEETMQPIWE